MDEIETEVDKVLSKKKEGVHGVLGGIQLENLLYAQGYRAKGKGQRLAHYFLSQVTRCGDQRRDGAQKMPLQHAQKPQWHSGAPQWLTLTDTVSRLAETQ